MTDRTWHVGSAYARARFGETGYAFFAMPVKRKHRKTCDPLRKGAKVVDSPKLLKTGVNSPVTTQIYA
jgi:hypothetical protein